MITLQNLIFPDPLVCTEHDLYYRASGDFGVSVSAGEVHLQRGAKLTFDTYFNVFSVAKWSAACGLDRLYAELRGDGLVELRVLFAIPGQSWEILSCEIVTLAADAPFVADLSHFADFATRGVIYMEIRALGPMAVITGGRFATRAVPDSLPRLALSITTFKREKEIRRTVARLESFLADFTYGDNIHVQVVDNGQSAGITASDRVHPIDNANYGGAGGFARGLLEAQKAGFTHCLFMDDDASFHMENVLRSYMFLALAKDPRTAVAGAMINNSHKWAMWENGAYFEGSCHPMFCGVDLRSRDAVFAMEDDSARMKPPTLYGGWWFFAFAIDQVRHHPFPFFVRGDDISFSLMNDFDIHTLNGVVSFQDDFTEKESPQTLYLDLRNHLVHHLVSDKLTRGPLGTAKIALRFVMRSLLRFHYDSARVQLLSWQDVMEGPEFFDTHIDMAERRATIKEMTKTEIWGPVAHDALSERRRKTLKSDRARHRMGVWLMNGHLVPFSARRWDRIVLGIGKRALVPPAFGAARITYLNTDASKSYTVRQSKAEFFSIGWQMARSLWRFLRMYDALKTAYRDGYQEMTTQDYWTGKLAAGPDLPQAPADPETAPPPLRAL